MKKASVAIIVFCVSVVPIRAQEYVISTFAGGVPPPTPAPGINMPVQGGGTLGVATDAAGNTYFTGFHCIFKMDPKRYRHPKRRDLAAWLFGRRRAGD
jgi:hypothetical protein